MDRVSLDEIFTRLRADPPDESIELERIYRTLIKRTHPDRLGDDGRLFLYFRDEFDRYREQWSALKSRETLRNQFDPRALLVDLGLSPALASRPALYAALYRFQSLGLASWRVRSRSTLRKRNAAVIRAVLYWAYEYDATFVSVFQDFLMHQGSFTLTEPHAMPYSPVRRTVLRGLEGVIRYQDRAHRATAEIARDRIAYALDISAGRGREAPFAALHALGRWLLGELEYPPERIGLDL